MTLPPTVYGPADAVLVPETEAAGAAWIVSVSVAALLAGFGSGGPPSIMFTVAVLESVPVAVGEMVHGTVKVTLPPAGKLMASLMLPLPEALQTPPPAPAQVQVQVSQAGKVSAIEAPPGASLGPALETVMV